MFYHLHLLKSTHLESYHSVCFIIFYSFYQSKLFGVYSFMGNTVYTKSETKCRVFKKECNYLFDNLYFIIIIIIIMSCRQHGYPWPSLATSPYHSTPPAGLLGYIPCPHIAAVCKFELVVLLLLGHMWGSIGVRHLQAHPCFSSSVQRVWLV